ncbi:restriction endonuclease subunit S [Streptomyces sp. NPDC049590]|uniref:restriction endonuclease subunit S n=1 Tax=Streptomyces sp. NPDC049590 TaxID=3154834 RepID=UPI0034447E16
MSSVRTVPLGDIASFVRGVTFKPDDIVEDSPEDTVDVLRTKNVQTELDLSDVWAISPHHVKREEQYTQEGDILISSANSWNLVGKCSWIPELDRRTTFGGFVTVLRGDSARVNRRYLYHWFSSPKVQATVRSYSRQTTNISNLDLKRCSSLAVPLPEMREQERIVEVLDQVDTLRVKRRQSMALLDDLVSSIIWKTLPGDAEIACLDDVLQRRLRNGISPSSKGTCEGKVLTLSSLTRGDFDESAWKIGLFESDPTKEYSVKSNMFMLVRGNGNKRLVGVGRFSSVAIPDVVYPDTVLAAPIREDLIVPEYLEAIWKTSAVRRQVEAVARTTNGTYKVNQKTMGAVKIPLPGKGWQIEFQERVQAVLRARNLHRDHLAKLDELFTSVRQRAFNGTFWDREPMST